MQAEPEPSLPLDDMALPEMARLAPVEAARQQRSARAGMLKRAGVILLVATPYVTASAFGWTVCVAAGISGYPCPGCGLTRASAAALGGDLAQAFHLHPLFPMIAPLYVYLLGFVAYGYVMGARARRLSPRADRAVSVLAVAAIVALLGVWIARFFGAFGGPAPVQSWF